MSEAVIAAAVAAAVAGIPATAAIVSSRRGRDADAGRTIGETYSRILDELRDEMARRDRECERRITDLDRRVEALERLVVSLGGVAPR